MYISVASLVSALIEAGIVPIKLAPLILSVVTAEPTVVELQITLTFLVVFQLLVPSHMLDEGEVTAPLASHA